MGDVQGRGRSRSPCAMTGTWEVMAEDRKLFSGSSKFCFAGKGLIYKRKLWEPNIRHFVFAMMGRENVLVGPNYGKCSKAGEQGTPPDSWRELTAVWRGMYSQWRTLRAGRRWDTNRGAWQVVGMSPEFHMNHPLAIGFHPRINHSGNLKRRVPRKMVPQWRLHLCKELFHFVLVLFFIFKMLTTPSTHFRMD